MDSSSKVSSALDVVILAAGRGTRMKTKAPKVLAQLGGMTLISRVISTALTLKPSKIVIVVGHEAEAVKHSVMAAHPGENIEFVVQSPQLGTGHAVLQALPRIGGEGAVLVLSGDVPLIRKSTLVALRDKAEEGKLTLLTLILADPKGYGRIKRSGHRVVGIVEEKDASVDERKIDEVYSGILCSPAGHMQELVSAIGNSNAQGEYYLTDVVELAASRGYEVESVCTDAPSEVEGVNDLWQLAALERAHQLSLAKDLCLAGVKIVDPARIDIRGSVEAGRDVIIDINCVFTGKVVLKDRVQIGAGCIIEDATIGEGTVIHPMTVIQGGAEGVRIGAGSIIGPYSRLRPGTVLDNDVHVGNFVEIKNSQLGRGTKANHLAYLGDASIAEHVNVGAGAITANYDGANKHRTTLQKNVHIGSNSVLVAPVEIGEESTVAAGSVITKSVGKGALAIGRGQQVIIEPWRRPQKVK